MKVTRSITGRARTVLAAAAACSAVALAAGGPVASAHPVDPAEAIAACPAPSEPMRHFLPIDVPAPVACVAPDTMPMPGFPAGAGG